MITSASNSCVCAAGSASSTMNSAHGLPTADSAAAKQDAAFNKVISSAGSLSSDETMAVGILQDHWASLPKNKDGYVSKEMLSSISKDAKLPSDVRAAAKFLIDNPSSFNKVDIAYLTAKNGSDSLDNLISYEDLDTTLNASQNHSTPASALSMPDASAASGATESGKVKTKTSTTTTTVTTADGTTTTTTTTEGSNAHDRPRAGGPGTASSLDPAAKAKQVEQHLSDLMALHGYKTIDDLEAAHPEVKDLYDPNNVDRSFKKVIRFLENLPVDPNLVQSTPADGSTPVDGTTGTDTNAGDTATQEQSDQINALMAEHGYANADEMLAANPTLANMSVEDGIAYLQSLPVDPNLVQSTPTDGSTPVDGTTGTDTSTGDTLTQAQSDQINALMTEHGYANVDEMLAANPTLANMSVEDGIAYLQNLPVEPNLVQSTPTDGSTPVDGTTGTDTNAGDALTPAQSDQINVLMTEHGYANVDEMLAANPTLASMSVEDGIAYLQNLPVDPTKAQPTSTDGATPANGTTSTDSNTGDTATQAQKDQINYLMAVGGYANADEMLAANPSLAGMSVEDGIKYLQNLPVDPNVVQPNSI
jgi:cupin superfamily acireductone dioxygenase involved in methionine salvage